MLTARTFVGEVSISIAGIAGVGGSVVGVRFEEAIAVIFSEGGGGIGVGGGSGLSGIESVWEASRSCSS
jgi:hypothetical protein